jgi:hypothetical protein
MRIIDSHRGDGESMRKILHALENNKKIICKNSKEKNKLLRFAKKINAEVEIITIEELRSEK